MREKISALEPGSPTQANTNSKMIADIRRDQDAFQRRQQTQMDTLMETMNSLKEFKQIVEDVAILRQDTNLLMENQLRTQTQQELPPGDINVYAATIPPPTVPSEILDKIRQEALAHDKS